MATNEILRLDARVIDMNLGASTYVPGAPVIRNGIPGVCQTASDGGVAAGYAPTPIAGQAAKPGRRQAVNHASVMCGGVHKLTVVAASAMAESAAVYITSSDTLTDVSTNNTLFGYLYQVAVGSAGTVKVPVLVLKKI